MMKHLLLLFLLLSSLLPLDIKSQVVSEPILQFEYFADMPEPVANNAVVMGTSAIYSFGGIDSSKSHSGIHLKSWKYDLWLKTWTPIPDLPDTMGKIAAAATLMDSVIYIIGGYHVFPNGNEKSSNRVHRFDCVGDTFLTDGMNLPVAIDDHVQAVWRDSLIYVITGWSNNGNESLVQIYNPAADTWTSAVQFWNSSIYSSFGASGTIVGDTIYYLGGARYAANFPIQDYLRIGIIDSTNPLNITWSDTLLPGLGLYRAACLQDQNKNPLWVGGSRKTYNYNGLAYSGSTPVPTAGVAQTFANDSMYVWDESGGGVYDHLPMDLRGVASSGYGSFYTCGGMVNEVEVSDKLIFSAPYIWHGVEEEVRSSNISMYPNPAFGYVNFDSEHPIQQVQAVDELGRLIYEQEASNIKGIDLPETSGRVLYISLKTSHGETTKKLIKQ